jgi:hypothetical protein
VSSNNLDKDGVQMICEADDGSSEFYLSDSNNINEGNFIITDRNSAQKMSENGLVFWRVKSNSVGYGDDYRGRTVRVNINGGGGLNEKQKHDWKDNPGPQFIWTPLDNRNAEFTYYFRPNDKFQGQPGKTNFNHTECSSKLRGGIHTGRNNPKASCVELKFKIGQGNNSLKSSMEYNHPRYVPNGAGKSTIKLTADNNTSEGQWIGRKTIIWTNSDNKSATARDYIDLDPYDFSGKPKNNWKPLQEQLFTTEGPYNKPILWGGRFASRIDGFWNVDYAIVSIREIKVPPRFL